MTKPADPSRELEPNATTSRDASRDAPRDASARVEKQRTSVRPGGPAALIGTTLSGRYRIERLLGEGGMGAVYQAEHTHMRKRLAVKVLHPEMSRLPEVVARFEREAMAAAHIDHPNVATATDFGKLEDGSFFLVLEYVEGQSLRELLTAERRLELGRALHITQQIASALLRAHALGIVHRDLKPENVMLVEREGDPDFVKVLDFGIAKVPVGELSSAMSAPADRGPAPVLTQLGMVYGTPEYMAPEQALGQTVDSRADLYSLGIMFYEMLAGVRPFDHESKVSLLGMHVTARVPPFAEKTPEALVPPEVEAIVMRLLAKESTERFTDAKELIDAILNVMAILVERGRIDPSFARAPLLGPAGSSPNLSSLAGARGGAIVSNPSSIRGSQAAIFGSMPTVASESGQLRTLEAKKSKRTAAVVAAILGGLSIFVVIAVIFAGRTSRHEIVFEGEGGVPAAPSAIEPTPTTKSDETAIRGALTDIEKGDYGSGIAALDDLEPKYMDRPDIHRALEHAYMATKNAKAAMKEAGLLVRADPAAVNDPKLLEDVRNAAIGRDAADEAFGLLDSAMGSVGIDVLYEIAHATWSSQYPAASARAQKTLKRSDVRARATPPLGITLDLREATTCDAKKGLFGRAREVGDYRTLAVLKGLVPTRGCGFLGSRDCWGCVHKDGSLAKTIDAVEERLPKKP